MDPVERPERPSITWHHLVFVLVGVGASIVLVGLAFGMSVGFAAPIVQRLGG